ncbi:MAG: hypothetical protein P8077_09300 [Gammaproteobacteria bacterium]
MNLRYAMAAFCTSVMLPLPVIAIADSTDYEQLKQQIDALKRKVDTLETAPTTTKKSQAVNVFNPAVSLILSGQAGYFDKNPENYSIPGFTLGEEAGPGEEGLSLGESEMSIFANVDNVFYGQFTVALTPENEAEIEEAYLNTLTLPAGLTVRFGRFKSGIGYLNDQHSHVWDFVDAPLVYRAIFGNQFADDGLRVTWLAPTPFFLEFGTEAFRGESMPAGGAAHHGVGAYTLYAHVGGDVGFNHSWQAGLSHLDTNSRERVSEWELGDTSFSGDNAMNIADLVWKWSPNGNPYEQSFKFQMEYLWGDEIGNYEGFGDIDRKQDGWYAQAIYQFAHSWRVGARYGQVSSDNPGIDFVGTELDPEDSDPRRSSIMVDYGYHFCI